MRWLFAPLGFTAALCAAHAGALPPPLDLDAFEDTDCLEDPASGLLLELLAELCQTVEDLLRFPGDANARANFEAWRRERSSLLVQLSGSVFQKPFCEPGKVAGTAAMCVLLLGDLGDESAAQQAYSLVQDLDNLLQQTAAGEKNPFDTRLHMFLRSPWPAFRLLDLVVRLFPTDDEFAEPHLGRCQANEDWVGGPTELDWPWFKTTLRNSLDLATMDLGIFALDPRDGPLSEQYRARWIRLYRTPAYREVAGFGSTAFYQYRTRQWEAGCHPGVVASYLMQVVTFCIRDTEAWLHRYVGASWRLLNTLSPIVSLVYSEWPLFRALYVGSLLRRHPTPFSIGTIDEDAPLDVASNSMSPKELQDLVRLALDPPPRVVYVTMAWGHLSRHAGPYFDRWSALGLPMLLFLALDEESAGACRQRRDANAGPIACIEMPQRFGVESTVAKYIVLAVAAQCVPLVAWVDLDVYLASDPTAAFERALAEQGSPPLALSTTVTSRSLSPSILLAKGAEASSVLLRYGAWLYEHPYILDHQGWDAFLQNPDGDFSGSWDYKGRNITFAPSDGLQMSFAPPVDGTEDLAPPRYAVLGREFASGDGLLVPVTDLVTFHFWGALEGQADLFEVFYPYSGVGFTLAARAVLAQCVRRPVSLAAPSVRARAQTDVHITAITYASGCCAKSIERNRRSALEVGVDTARAYGIADLDQDWAARHAAVLSQKKGGGWWLWKPYLILKTLQDDAVPWHTGVVLWLDAGNFYVGDPRPVVANALRRSDVAAMRLKCCAESDWTSLAALEGLGGNSYVISDLPQIGAYFLILRKTTTTLAFVEDWLRFSEEPELLLELGVQASVSSAPGYQRHMADQSIFSVLFKQRGFEAMSLEQGHTAVQLDRWRE